MHALDRMRGVWRACTTVWRMCSNAAIRLNTSFIQLYTIEHTLHTVQHASHTVQHASHMTAKFSHVIRSHPPFCYLHITTWRGCGVFRPKIPRIEPQLLRSISIYFKIQFDPKSYERCMDIVFGRMAIVFTVSHRMSIAFDRMTHIWTLCCNVWRAYGYHA